MARRELEITENTRFSGILVWVVGGALLALSAYGSATIQNMNDRLAVLEAQLSRIECKVDPTTCTYSRKP